MPGAGEKVISGSERRNARAHLSACTPVFLCELSIDLFKLADVCTLFRQFRDNLVLVGVLELRKSKTIITPQESEMASSKKI